MAERPAEEFSEKPLPATPKPTGEFSEKPLPPLTVEPISEDEPKPNAVQVDSLKRMEELQARGYKGANWFFWVAGLSIINSIGVHGGAKGYFVVGLAITLVVDSIANAVVEQHLEYEVLLRVISFGFTLAVAVVVVVVGWLARRGILTVFGIGMFLYVLDGVLFLFLQDWMSVAFHGWALVGMFAGFSAFREIRKFQANLGEEVN